MLDNTLLLLGFLDRSDRDLIQLELHVVNPLLGGCGIRASGGRRDECSNVIVTASSSLDMKSLLDRESDLRDIELALRVVDLNLSFSDLTGREDVLVEHGLHLRYALLHAAPCCDFLRAPLSGVGLQLDRPLTDGNDLLVLHLVSWVHRVQVGLQVVLNFGLGVVMIVHLEVQRRGHLLRKHTVERDLVHARIEHATLNLVNGHLDLKEFLLVLHLLFLVVCTFAVRLSVMIPEGGLFHASKFQIDVRGLDLLQDLQVHEALDGIARFVEGQSGLHLHASFSEPRLLVSEK